MDYKNQKITRVLEVEGLCKDFPGVRALSDFSFELYKGEVHCLIGENGAGKSTFIKILSGFFKPTAGNIFIDGDNYNFLTPHLARKIGIQTVYQEDILVPQISASENIFLGSEKDDKKLFISYKRMADRARRLANKIGIDINMEESYGKLSPPDQQFVKILKALALEPKVLILDEPTQAFNIKDIGLITDMVKRISREGVSVIYIAHNLDEVIEVASRVTVLRDGRKINTHDKKEETLDSEDLAKEMVGRPVNLFYKKKAHAIGDSVFEVKGLKLKQDSKKIDFNVKEGEILGLAGLKGSGRTEIARAIFGALSKHDGDIFFKGHNITPDSPGRAVKAGMAFLTENNKIDGLFMGMPVDQNITIVGLENIGRFFINLRKEKKLAGDYVEKLKIKTPSLDQEVRFLSGGNQQKVVLAKWLFKGVDILIVDEPTHGIDVNAKVEVYELFTELASSGKSIIMISSDMPELISISDRVIVIRNFEISKILQGNEITEENILSGFMGGR
jgi:ribose transport system ATP-binding protein